MNRLICSLMLSGAVGLLSFVGEGKTVTVNGLRYDILNAGEVRVGDNRGYSESSVKIPSEIEYEGITYSVVEIGHDAFSESFADNIISSIEIPNTIRRIGPRAFKGCFRLSSVKIPGSVKVIDTDAFTVMNIKYIELEEGIEYIASGAFCKALDSSVRSLTIPNSVKYIGQEAFEEAWGLRGLYLGNSLRYIGNTAFRANEYATSIDFPSSLNAIGESAFLGWVLRSINFLDDSQLCYIGHVCFWRNNLTYANLGGMLGKIDREAFGYNEFREFVIPNSTLYVSPFVFYNCDDLTNLTIGSDVRELGKQCFAKSESAKKDFDKIVCLPQEAPIAADDIFDMPDYRYATLMIPEGSMESYSSSVPWSQFLNVEEQKEITGVESRVITINGVNYGIWEDEAYVANNYGFEGDCVIPSYINYGGRNYPVTYISGYAFSENENITSVVIGDNVRVIEDYAFNKCKSLENVNIGYSVERIGDYAFYMSPIKAVYTGLNTRRIGAFAFYNTQLRRVVLGPEVNYIDNYAFSAYSLTEVECASALPAEIEDHTFSPFLVNRLVVPDGCREEYATAEYWSEFTNIETSKDAGVSDRLLENAIPEIYVNLAGVKSRTPWDGVNIVIYSNGQSKREIYKR